MKTRKINDLDSGRPSKRVWKMWENHGRLRTDTHNLLISWDMVLTSTGIDLQPLNLSFGTTDLCV